MNETSDARPDSSVNADGRNGARTLTDRVQSLRLPERGSRGTGKLPWVLCLLLLGSTVVFAYQSFSKRGTGGNAEKPQTPRVDERTAGSGDVVLESKGYVIPERQIQISPLVSGRILELNVVEGMRVKKGQVLAVLDTIEYDKDHRRALAQLEAARARLAEAREMEEKVWKREIEKAEAEVNAAVALQNLREAELKRAEELYRKLAIQRQEYDVAVANQLSAKAQTESARKALEVVKVTPRRRRTQNAEAELQQAEAEVARTQMRLDFCTIYAPEDGTILTKKAEKGNLVNPVAFNVSASLCEMANLALLEIDLSIQERDIARIFERQKCYIMPEAFQNNADFKKKYPRGYEGYVSRQMPIADRAKGAIPVRVRVTNVPPEEEGKYLKPDMGVIVSFTRVKVEEPKQEKPLTPKGEEKRP